MVMSNKKKLNPNQVFIPQQNSFDQQQKALESSFGNQSIFLAHFYNMVAQAELGLLEFEEIGNVLSQILKGKQTYIIHEFEIFDTFSNKCLAILKNKQIRRNGFVKLLLNFQLKCTLKSDQENKLIGIIKQFSILINQENPYFSRYLLQALLKLLDHSVKTSQKIVQMLLQLLNSNLSNNVFLQTSEGLIFIIISLREIENLYKLISSLPLSIVEKSFTQLFKFLFIGTDKFQLKSYLIQRNEEIRSILSGISDYSDSDQKQLIKKRVQVEKLEYLFQKLRNTTCVCMATLIRQYPKLILNTKNFFTLLKPIIFPIQFTKDLFNKNSDEKFTKLVNNTLFINESCLVQALLIERAPKNKINVINVMVILIEQFNQKYVFLTQRYEKEQKITNPNFLPLAQQVYYAIKHLFCGIISMFLKEEDCSVINFLLRFLSIYIAKGYLDIFPDNMVESLYNSILKEFLNTSEEISTKTNALNCLSQILHLQKRYVFIEQDLMQESNLIQNSLKTIEKQLNIESLQNQNAQVVKSQSMAFLFENLLILQKVQKTYNSYFFPYYDHFIQVYKQLPDLPLNSSLTEYHLIRLKFFYKILEEISKTLSPHLMEYQRTIVDFIIQIIPKSIKINNHELLNISFNMFRNIAFYMDQKNLQNILKTFLNDIELPTTTTKQNLLKTIAYFVQNDSIFNDDSINKMMVEAVLQQSVNIGVQMAQATALLAMCQKGFINELVFDKWLDLATSIQDNPQVWQGLKIVIEQFQGPYKLVELKKIVKSDGWRALKMCAKIWREAKFNKLDYLIDSSFFKFLEKGLDSNLVVQRQIQILKILKLFIKNPKFRNKDHVCEICFSFMNNENKEIQYDDFKNFQKLKKHLTALTISLISQNVNFIMNYTFYEYFWFYISIIFKPIQVEADYEKLENIVEDQMKRKSTVDINLDQIQQKNYQILSFDLSICKNKDLQKNIIDNILIIQQASQYIYKNQTLPQFNYEAFKQFQSIQLDQKNFLKF